MKKSKQAIAILMLAVTTSCTSQHNLSTPPPLTAEVLQVHSTADTSQLATIVIENYYDNDIILVHSNDNDINLLNQVMTGEIDYFFTHHLPTNAQDYWSAPLVQDGIAIIRHQDNTVTELSIEQLRRIYRGFITNWAELGGDNAEISIYSREENASIRLEFEQLVMGQQRTSPNARILSSSNAIIEQLSQDTYGIGYIPISLLNTDISTMAINSIVPTTSTLADDSYALRLNIYAIGLQAPINSYSRLFAWIQTLDSNRLDNHYAPLPR